MDKIAATYRRFLDGDQNAFDEIIKSQFDRLMFFIDRYVHDLRVSEDIAIDSFAELKSKKSGYNFKVSLKAYLFAMGRIKAMKYIKNQSFVDVLDFEDSFGTSEDEDQLKQTVLNSDNKWIVNSALDRLSDDMKIAVHLVYFEDMSYAQTAFVMGKSLKEIDNLIFRAKSSLCMILNKEDCFLL